MIVFHNEDGNPARANIKQALGYFKDGDGDGNSLPHKGVKASANSDVMYSFTSAQDGNPLQDDWDEAHIRHPTSADSQIGAVCGGRWGGRDSGISDIIYTQGDYIYTKADVLLLEMARVDDYQLELSRCTSRTEAVARESRARRQDFRSRGLIIQIYSIGVYISVCKGLWSMREEVSVRVNMISERSDSDIGSSDLREEIAMREPYIFTRVRVEGITLDSHCVGDVTVQGAELEGDFLRSLIHLQDVLQQRSAYNSLSIFYLPHCPSTVSSFIIRNLNGTISIAFIINNFEITLSLVEFAWILKIHCQGVCVYTPEWPISSLQNDVESHPDIYPPPHEDSSLIRDALFYERTQPKTQKMKGVDTFLDPFQMIVSELKIDLKK
ncbi:hypothetical protein Tco_0316311 [Tanacetum coccineum]